MDGPAGGATPPTDTDTQAGVRERPSHFRHFFHFITGILLAFGVYALEPQTAAWLVGSLFFLTIVGEILRLRIRAINRLFIVLFGYLLKDAEFDQPTGVGYFLGGVFFCLLLFQKEAALAGIVILSSGDPAAAAIGKMWGRIRVGRKTMEGALGFWGGAMIIGIFLQGFWEVLPLWVYATGALAGAIIELVPTKINDNLLVPLASALTIETWISYL